MKKFTLTEVLKIFPEATGRGQHFQVQGHSFSLFEPTLYKLVNGLFIFFPSLSLSHHFYYR